MGWWAEPDTGGRGIRIRSGVQKRANAFLIAFARRRRVLLQELRSRNIEKMMIKMLRMRCRRENWRSCVISDAFGVRARSWRFRVDFPCQTMILPRIDDFAISAMFS